MSGKTKRRRAVRYPEKLNEKLEPLFADFAEIDWRSEAGDVFTEKDQSDFDELLDRLSVGMKDPSWRSEYDEKFDLLCDYHSIERDSPDKWRRLALALAIDHVPGFQEKAGGMRGRKKGMESTLEVGLLGRFIELTGKGLSERNAARLIAIELERRTGIKMSAKAVLARVKRLRPAWDAHLAEGNDRPDGRL